MSILDKHPAPWTMNDFGELLDANGAHLVTMRWPSCVEAAELDHLILAAPELLAALKAILAGEPGARTPAHALIARIEGAT